MELRAYGACVLAALWTGAAAGCARIKGADELSEENGFGSLSDAGASLVDAAPNLDRDASGPDGKPDASALERDGGETGRDAASPASDAGDKDAAVPAPVQDGSCVGPFALTFNAGIAKASGNTTGGADRQAAPNSCVGLLPAVSGPEHVYHFKMPYRGELEAVTSAGGAFGTFVPAVYVSKACDEGSALVACDYAGNVAFGDTSALAAGSDVFVTVDSSGQDLGQIGTTPSEGAYGLEVALRELVGEGEGCGSGRTDPRCEGTTLVCRAEGDASVCRTPSCGDGHVGGAEQCDDGAKTVGDGCDAACKYEGETCGNAAPLSFVNSGNSRVSRVSRSTVGALNDIEVSCTYSPEHVYRFTLTATSSVKVEVEPAAGFDTAIALLTGSCSSAAQNTCQDLKPAGSIEAISKSLGAGTHYILVDGYKDTGHYALTVTITP